MFYITMFYHCIKLKINVNFTVHLPWFSTLCFNTIKSIHSFFEKIQSKMKPSINQMATSIVFWSQCNWIQFLSQLNSQILQLELDPIEKKIDCTLFSSKLAQKVSTSAIDSLYQPQSVNCSNSNWEVLWFNQSIGRFRKCTCEINYFRAN